MKLFLGLVEGSLPHESRIFGGGGGRLFDFTFAYATYLREVRGEREASYELASLYFPATISEFLVNGESSRQALGDLMSFLRPRRLQDFRGPAGGKGIFDDSR